MLSAAPAGAEVAPGVDAATVAGTAVLEVSADVDTASITPSARRGKRKARAAAADVEVPAAASGEGVAVQGCITPETAQPKRIRSRKAVPSAALPGDTAAVPVKPPRRTKKVIAEEVREAARLGQFGELTLLSEAYSHISLFTGSRNSQAWGELQAAVLDPAVAAAAGDPEDLEGHARAACVGVEQVLQQLAGADQHQHQHQQQHQQVATAGGIGACGTWSSSRALCKTSGLGSFKQQVWLHNTDAGLQSANGFCQQQQQMAAEKVQDTADGPDAPHETRDGESYQSTGAGTPADSSSSSTVIPNLGYACLCMTMRNYDVFNSRDCVKKTRNAPDGLQKVSQLALANAR
jgi:UV DNA damage endonuclease